MLVLLCDGLKLTGTSQVPLQEDQKHSHQQLLLSVEGLRLTSNLLLM